MNKLLISIATLLVALSISSTIAFVPTAFAQDSPAAEYAGPQPSGFISSLSDFVNDPSAPGVGAISKMICTDGTDLGGGNIRINCDSIKLPHNEMSIAVDPANPNHIVAGSNDYELFFVGRTLIERIIAGYYTSFDGGSTWLNGHLPAGGFTFTGDPAVGFNKKLGLVHYALIGFNSGQRAGFATATIQVNTSNDGGKTFGNPTIVALGTGGTRTTIFNDKPYIAVDNNPASPFYGRVYVTYTRFLFNSAGQYVESPIHMAFSDDGGKSFSEGKSISGSSATLCGHPFRSFNTGICNEDQFSTPTIGSDGKLYVAFLDSEFLGAPEFRDQVLVVSSTDGGQSFTGPHQAAFPVFDGVNDYPINVDGRQTLSNSQFRLNSAGALAVTKTGRLYYVFDDNRNGVLTGDFHTVRTNNDVFVVFSDNGGVTWTGPNPVLTGATALNDQFYPWAAAAPDGSLKVTFMDRSYDSNNVKYGMTLASTSNGVSFSAVRVDSGLSNPNDSRFFTNGGRTNGKSTFIGDYNGLAIGSNGVSHPIWTDMRTSQYPSPPPGRGHNTQDAVTVAVA